MRSRRTGSCSAPRWRSSPPLPSKSAGGGPTPLRQDFEHAGEAESAFPQQDAGVKPEVGDLAGQRVIAFLSAGEEDLDGFLAHLSEDRRAPTVEEPRRVGPRGSLGLPLAQGRIELVEDADGLRKARSLARVAGWPVGMHRKEQRVPIAVGLDLLDVQQVARRLALAPEGLPAAAPEVRL